MSGFGQNGRIGAAYAACGVYQAIMDSTPRKGRPTQKPDSRLISLLGRAGGSLGREMTPGEIGKVDNFFELCEIARR